MIGYKIDNVNLNTQFSSGAFDLYCGWEDLYFKWSIPQDLAVSFHKNFFV